MCKEFSDDGMRRLSRVVVAFHMRTAVQCLLEESWFRCKLGFMAFFFCTDLVASIGRPHIGDHDGVLKSRLATQLAKDGEVALGHSSYANVGYPMQIDDACE